MTRTLLWVIVIMSATVLAWAGHRWAAARAEAATVIRQLAVVSADVEELARMRASASPESRRPRPAPGLAARVADVVSKAALPQSALQNVAPEIEGAAGAGLKRQAAKITVDGLTLPELGRLLQRWRTDEPLWTVSTIDITPSSISAKARQLSPQTDRPLHAVIGIETIFSSTSQEGSR